MECLREQAINNNDALLFGDASHINQTIAPSKVLCIKGEGCIGFPSQKRGGRTSIIGALDAVTNELTHYVTTDSVNTETFSLFLDELRKNYPNKDKIHLILDNARYQKNKNVIEKAEMLRISLIFLPPYCPNLNLIERLWKFMKKKLSSFWIEQKKLGIYFLLSDFLHKFANGIYKKEIKQLFNFKFQII